MKYYIFGSNKKEIKESVSNAAYIAVDLALGKAVFEKFAEEIRYPHMYLIADYGCTGNKFLKPAVINPIESNDDFPYFIIMEFHIDDIDAPLVRSDNTQIYNRKGYTQNFDNNLRAALVFESLIRNKEDAVFTINYVLDKPFDYEKRILRCRFSKVIGETEEIDRRFRLGLEKYINKIKIVPPDWKFVPIEPLKAPANIDLKKDLNNTESVDQSQPVVSVISPGR